MGRPRSSLAGLRAKWSRADWRVFFAALIAGGLAKGAAFLPLYAIDDYRFLMFKPFTEGMIADGRFGQALATKLMTTFGFSGLHAGAASTAAGLAAFALLGTALVRHWGLRMGGWQSMAAASLVAVHPYSTEIFTFRTSLITYSMSIALLALLLLPRRWNRAGLIGGTLLFALTLSFYQSMLHFALMIWLMSLAVRLNRQRRFARRPPLRLYDRHFGLLACVICGIGVYGAIAEIVRRVGAIPPSGRVHLLPPAGAAARLREVADTLGYRFWQPEPLLSVGVKRLLLVLLALALVRILLRAWPWSNPRRLAAAGVAITLLAFGVVWTLGLSLVMSTFWPVPRTISHVSVLWSAALAIACTGAVPIMRWLSAGIAALVLVAFVGMDDRILLEQARINARDAATASRIVARLEAQPGFATPTRLAFVGKRDGYPRSIRTHDMDLNLSAFAATWAQVYVLVEASGYHFSTAKAPEEIALAANYCKTVAPWPGPQSVTAQGELAIICLEQSDDAISAQQRLAIDYFELEIK